ncbi:MAG TPA: hypothetical protein VKA73_14970 [Rubrobacter sp.]|nr:hypothetical protein [Rubrobacter sp.]
MEAGSMEDVTLWTIAYARNPAPAGESPALLCLPLPWDEGETVQAAVLVYESRALAEAGLAHYQARTGQDHHSYSLMAFSARELAEILREGPEGFDRVAINPILSLYFPGAEGYSAGLRAEDLAAEIKSAADPKRRW